MQRGIIMSKSNKSRSEAKRNFWRQHIDNWASGNVSQKKYCEQENLSFSSFSWWRNRGFKNKSYKTMTFVPATIINDPQPLQNQDLQLVFPNRLKLVLPATLPTKDLINLIQSLGELS